MDYGKKLREFRNEKGISQKELANLLGLSQPMLSGYESGRVKPSIETEKKIDEVIDGKTSSKERTPEEVLHAIIEKDEAKKEVEEVEEDFVNSPKHYRIPGCNFESITLLSCIIKDLPGSLAFSVGNAIKYVIRAERKNGKEDYEKARVYLQWSINFNYSDSGRSEDQVANLLCTDWLTIISGICEGMSLKKGFLMNELFKKIILCDYEKALLYLNKILELY